MPKKDPRVDAYIIKSADFALPVLQHLRALVHAACPDVVETLKWSMPHFMFKDQMLCGMASFKQHCSFGFWKASLMKDAKLLTGKEGAGSIGKVTSLKDLPSDKKIMGWIKEAMKLTEAGAKVTKAKPATSRSLVLPAFFSAALASNKKAKIAFERFSPSQKKDYADWLAEAKTIPTRERRLEQAINQIEEGKTRHWKYVK